MNCENHAMLHSSLTALTNDIEYNFPARDRINGRTEALPGFEEHHLRSIMSHLPQIRDSKAMGTAIAFIVIGSIAGFFLGRLTTRAASPESLGSRRAPGSSANTINSTLGFNEEDEDEENQGLQSFENQREEMKLILVVRTDLGMTKGGVA
jgi:hypothetical protein